ncbi:hypothetical protein BCR36DRAFT_363385 [Piromyces finnis]|uniref:Uncharacterized protein n=1 Tax=Piromyces finnis TaxID=1754191 RepID=A0A1Y1UV63_9FUNG|nr:hypothetical protein BCR36DRAFT_363385 [Piromyces finnis]|eukprot:ORX41919.1 hypothetical protein BCR36DRAFT_363385 [Piromyces finnis]
MSIISSNTTSTTNVTNKIIYGPPSLVIGDIAIEKKAIENDLRYLLQEFIKLKSLKFKDFVNLWEELDFTLIQFICTDKNYRNKYLMGLYEIPISYLIQFNNAYMDIGNLYILYMLYYTQPNAFPKVLIKITQYVWIKLCNINEWAKKHNLYDTMYIFYKMKYDQIFEFVAYCKGQEGLEFTKK